MSKPVVLCADSTCDLSPELVERYQVHIFPLHVLLDDMSYADGVDITPDDIYRVYRERQILPKTAAIGFGEYVDFCKPFIDGGAEVVYITLGSGLSSTNQNCRLAAAELPGLYVVDSCNLSTGSGLLVLEAADRIAAGLPAAQVAEEVQALTSHCHASFVLDKLEFLYKGGRCSALAMMGANLLQLKPCIEVDNTSGKMGVSKKYRGSYEKAVQQYVHDQLDGRTDIDAKRVFVTHSGVPREQLEAVEQLVAACYPFEEILETRAGCTISSHCGPNTLGVLYMTK